MPDGPLILNKRHLHSYQQTQTHKKISQKNAQNLNNKYYLQCKFDETPTRHITSGSLIPFSFFTRFLLEDTAAHVTSTKQKRAKRILRPKRINGSGGTPRCMPARSSLLALVVRFSPSLFACRPRRSPLAVCPSQFFPRWSPLAVRPSQFFPRPSMSLQEFHTESDLMTH